MTRASLAATFCLCLAACNDTSHKQAEPIASHESHQAEESKHSTTSTSVEKPLAEDKAINENVTADAETNITQKADKPSTEINITNKPFAQPDSQNRQLFETLIANIASEKDAIDYQSPNTPTETAHVAEVCQKIDAKLASVKLNDCLDANLRLTPYASEQGVPIVLTEFPPFPNKQPLGRVLLIGGTHGDELTSVSIVFKWIKILQQYHSGLFHWHIVPMMNPDGVLQRKATRPNARGVDLNRNMPTPDWSRLSKVHWKKIDQDPRKNPGMNPASEQETQWLIHEIESFQPDAIVSVHAPYGILDFDGPDLSSAPQKFGRLRLNLLGTYPGSLGNYAGINKNIPVLTLELPHAWTMPKPNEVNSIWTDMVKWLKRELS